MTTAATTAPLLTRQRQDLIRQRLERDGRVLAGPLAQELAVSEDTIRRDLRELASLGACERVYGGAVKRAPKAAMMAERILSQTEEKSRLGKAVADLIEPGETVFIDAGSTNVAVAAALPHGAGLTVVTNAPAVASAVPPDAGIAIVLLGGRFDPRLGACLGARTLREAGRLHPDVMIIGACGVDPVAGVTASEVEEAELKLALATASRRVIAAATRDKLGTAAPFAVMAIERLSRLVVDDDADPALLSAFSEQGVRVSRVSD